MQLRSCHRNQFDSLEQCYMREMFEQIDSYKFPSLTLHSPCLVFRVGVGGFPCKSLQIFSEGVYCLRMKTLDFIILMCIFPVGSSLPSPTPIKQDDTTTPSSRQTWPEKVELRQANKSGRLPCESEKTGLQHRKRDADGRAVEFCGSGDT